MQNKYKIKIPQNINIIYYSKKNILLIIGPIKSKILQLKVKLNYNKYFNIIEVTSDSFKQIPNNEKKQLKAIQGTTVALIKQFFVETSFIIYNKLKFIGVGYRVFNVEEFETKVIMCKLGYSHPVYFKIPNKLKVYCLKYTKLFIYGNSYQHVTQITSFIRSYKIPEPYKGKGILYNTEKIILKKGKKI